jgi:hypothetical protein
MSQVDDCEIDYCIELGTKAVRLDMGDSTIKIPLCETHADAVVARLAENMGLPAYAVKGVLQRGNLPGTVGEFRAALDYVDGLTAPPTGH